MNRKSMKFSQAQLRFLIAILKPWEPSEDWSDQELKEVEKLLKRFSKAYIAIDALGGDP